jgi:hypothetical protein
MATNMLYSQNLWYEYWAEVVINEYSRNKCFTSTLEEMTPQEVWMDQKPCISHISIFRCILYGKIFESMKRKLKAKGIRCVFLGYYEDTKAYELCI